MMSITDEKPESSFEKRPVSQEQLQHEVDYVKAQQILESMLDNGLISLLEFDKITALNRESFSPDLAQIMPSNCCYHPHSEVTYHTD